MNTRVNFCECKLELEGVRAREFECELDRNASIRVSVIVVKHNPIMSASVNVCTKASGRGVTLNLSL